ncbi:hypothetical protein ABEF95_005696 [Exophiala dermatitidis]
MASSTTSPMHIPFKDLPLHPDHPPHSAWGVWGKDDQLGCLNRLTPECIKKAAAEVKTGVSIGLNWSMDEMHVPPFYRTDEQTVPKTYRLLTALPSPVIRPGTLELGLFRLTLHTLSVYNVPETIISQTFRPTYLTARDPQQDDRLEFNTQTSTQWDGFRHWAFPDGRFYNGFTQAELKSGTSQRNGIQEWAKRGIVGRGVLIDYVEHAKSVAAASGTPDSYDPWSATAIPVSTIQEIARKCNITFEPGDILLLRTGFVHRYERLSEAELQAKMADQNMTYPGLKGSLESLEWLWDTQFSCVGADSPGFEVWQGGLGVMEFRMHETILSGLGLPIGELFDLEELARQCAKEKRWTFMFTSEVLNVPGGVASPPNALAIM